MRVAVLKIKYAFNMSHNSNMLQVVRIVPELCMVTTVFTLQSY